MIFLRHAHGTNGTAATAVERNSHPACFALVLVIALASATILPRRASAQDQATSTPDKLSGTVINSVTHAPIARALVSFGQMFATLTDGEGHFEFTISHREAPGGYSGGIYRPQARKPGFLDDHNAGSDAAAIPGTDLTLYLVPETLIIGRVILATGEPAARISVQIFSRQVQDGVFRWIPGEQTQANSNGEFRFAELAAGSYKVLTHEYMDNDPITTVPGRQSYGYPPVYYPNAVDFTAANVIQLTAGETFQADISAVRHPYFQVKIPFANPPESAFGISVSVSPVGHSSPGYSLGYNRQKQSIEGSLPDGNYLVEATTYDQSPKSGSVILAVTGPRSAAPAMVLTPNGSVAVNVKEEFTSVDPRPAGSWSDGQHTFSFQGPRTYLNLNAESADDFEQHSAYLRAPAGPNDDSLAIGNIPPGRYWLRPSSSVGYVASATMGGLDLLHQPFVAGSGATTPIEITMRDDFAEIEGTVAGATVMTAAPGAYGIRGDGGRTVPLFGPSAYVYLVPLADSPGQFEQLGIDSEGKFDSQRVVPGTYRVMAFKNAQPNLPYRDAEAMKAYQTKGQVVHLAAGEKTTVELQLISDND